MFSYLGLTDNEDYMTFAALCEDGHEPRGLANADSIGYSNGGLSYSPPAIVQFDVNMDGVDVPDGGLVQVCGTFNNWCHYPKPGQQPPHPGWPNGPVTLTKAAGFINRKSWAGQITLPAGTWAYKYRVVPNGEQCVGRCDDSDWEDVPEECGVAWGGAGGGGFDRVLTVTSSPNSQFHGAEGQALGPGVSVMDEWEECGTTNPCTIEPQLDATFLVRSHDIAGVWVAFFSRCQQYRC